MGVSITRIVKFIRKGERGNGVINAVTPIRRNTLSFWKTVGATNYAYTWANISNYADMKIGDTMVIQGVVTDKNNISVTYYGTIKAINTTSVKTTATALIMSGVDGSSFAAQYSINGATNWHETFTDGDIYMRTSDDNGKTWSDAIRIVGEKGNETNYQFAWSSHKSLDESEDPLSDVVDWNDYPPKQPDNKPYLWTMITTPDGKVSYARLTGEKGDKGDKGDPGSKGERGPALRGPQAWSDCAVGYVFQSGSDGEEYKDVVLYNNNYYSCVKSHAKTASNAPLSSADTNNGYWKFADKFEIIATKILLAQYALVKNLGVEVIDMKDSAGNVIFQAMNGDVICNSGTFNNITVKGNSTLEGIVKAQLYYSPTKQITTSSNREYTINPQTEPCCSFLINEPTNTRFVTLPKASLYDGLEIQIFTKVLSGAWDISKMTFAKSNGSDSLFVRANAYNIDFSTTTKRWGASVNNYAAEYKDYKDSSIYMCPNCVCKFKSINGAWYAIEGLYTGE